MTTLSLRSLRLAPTSTFRIATVGTRTRHFHRTPPRLALYPKADEKTFNKVVEVKDRVILVDFYADWCGPCHQLSPILEKLTKEPNTSGSGLPLDLVKIDTDAEFELGQKYKVRALPTVIAFKDGKPVSQFVGALRENDVKGFLEAL
ncbi:thioredoxin-like protein [Crucibulum laeve]|uniref:Thioredoxin-like protein n=1 Tax=Crucibulum laeve TaxID=68775 RepID=A0A5C3MEN1_9AGAR|nr:thioredoxin-like protein [Crucibulum laeve]